MTDPVRRYLRKLFEERQPKIQLTKLSQEIGKNPAYMQQFMGRGVPLELPERVRAKLAEVLDIDERLLGAPTQRASTSARENNTLPLTQYDVRASAGAGAIIEEEPEVGQWHLPKNYVRHVLGVSSSRITLISIIGDSMEPTLRGGDVVMLDLNDTAVEQPGVFALYDGSRTVVKRLEKVLGSDPLCLRVISDNPRQSTYDVLAEQVRVAGRVIWFGRMM